jgi:hypothetical protein
LCLDLAEAATYCAGRMNIAISVLKFVAAQENLSKEHKERIIALCDLVKMTVRFDRDPKIVETSDSVVAETDVILAAISAPGSEKKPDTKV